MSIYLQTVSLSNMLVLKIPCNRENKLKTSNNNIETFSDVLNTKKKKKEDKGWVFNLCTSLAKQR